MDVFGKGTIEGTRPLLPPGTCWVCEQSPSQEAERVIDTRRNSRAGGSLSHESVRKYICESCATEMGGAMGMVSADEHAEVVAESTRQTYDLAALHDRLQVAESAQVKVAPVEEFLSVLREELAALKPKPRTTKPSVPAE